MDRVHRVSARHIALCASGILGASVLAADLLYPTALQATGITSAVATATALLAAAIAAFTAVRFRHTRSLRDAVTFAAVCAVGALGFASYVMTKAGLMSGGQRAAAAQLGTLLLAAGIAAIAFAPRPMPQALARGRLALWAGLGMVTATLAGVAAMVLAPAFPTAGGAEQGPGLAWAHPLALTTALLAAGILAAAALRFAREAATGRATSSLRRAGGCLVLVAAALDYLALPASLSRSVGPRQVLTLMWLGLFLIDVVLEDVALWREMTAAAARQAVLAERRRMSRDLHDGLAQDLAFIAAHGERMASDGEAEHPVAVAARRALLASRGIVADLAASDALTLRAALVRVGDELSTRFGIRVDVEAEEVPLSESGRDEIVRIAREAIANAARHGKASRVLVSVTRSAAGVKLSVGDDGCGIGGGIVIAGGFGMGMMAERAAALGGRLETRDTGGPGTQVDVLLP